MLYSHRHQGENSTMCKTVIKRFILHDGMYISNGLKTISWPTAVISHSPWALWLCSQKRWTGNFHHSLPAAIVGWKNQRMFLFKAVSRLPSLHLVCLLKRLVHGDASIRRDVMVFHENSVRFSGLIPTIYMKKKRTIIDAYKFCQEWGNLLAAESNYLAL